MSATLKLGTRRSLLAWAQSSWVAREIERTNPGVRVELVGIDTRGDKILDVSLQSVQGKEFFVAELDDALKSGAVDLTVHSMKDLSLDRPKEFALAAIPRRENPRDVVLFGTGVMEKIAAGQTLKIGTSSPRRLENIPGFLRQALPRVGGKEPQVNLVDIRGNVNTRLSRVHEPLGSPRHLDAVVLAFAGIIRLWADQAGQAELEKLLDGVRWMVLPLKECPAAPAQGALAIECRASDERVRAMLARIHDAKTAANVASERQLLADWGGGCHQKFGATRVAHPEAGDLLFIRGVKPDGAFVEELRWLAPLKTSCARAWDGKEWRAKGDGGSTGAVIPAMKGRACFVAHSRALPQGAGLGESRVWTSGASSWFKLAERGVWVEGCAEGLGFDDVAPTLAEKVLRLPAFSEWIVLTHDAASDGWQAGQVLSTYKVASQWDEKAKTALQGATHLYWSSGSQFDALKGAAPANAHHACGPGKTASHLRKSGLNPTVFPSIEEWRRWIGK